MSSDRELINETGQVTRWPKKNIERVIVLEYLTSKFQTDRSYTENEVNEVLRLWHTYNDWPTLRRELVGFKFATRDRNGLEYWFNEKKGMKHSGRNT